MQWDVWYDLAVLEMSDLSDPGKEKLIEAAEAGVAPDVDDEEEESADDGCGSEPRHVSVTVCRLAEKLSRA